MIIAFTGGRDYSNKEMVEFVIDLLLCCTTDDDVQEMRVGDCPTGLDAILASLPFTFVVYRASWGRFRKGAGPIRNAAMLAGSGNLKSVALDRRADLVIAFPGGDGTADCVRQARELGIAVIEVPA